MDPDLDPDPVGSAFIWVRGSGSESSHKMKGKAEFNQRIFGFLFRRKLYFSDSEPEKVADLNIFFLIFKRWFEINFIVLHTDWIRIRIHNFFYPDPH